MERSPGNIRRPSANAAVRLPWLRDLGGWSGASAMQEGGSITGGRRHLEATGWKWIRWRPHLLGLPRQHGELGRCGIRSRHGLISPMRRGPEGILRGMTANRRSVGRPNHLGEGCVLVNGPNAGTPVANRPLVWVTLPPVGEPWASAQALDYVCKCLADLGNLICRRESPVTNLR